MESLQALVDRLGVDVARNLVITKLNYPITSTVTKDVPLVACLTFEGISLQNLIVTFATETICFPVDMQGTIDDTLCVLQLLDDCKELILLSKADCVAIYRGGFCILTVMNELQPQSGKSICIDLNAVRNQCLKRCEMNSNERQMFGAVGACVALSMLAFITPRLIRSFK